MTKYLNSRHIPLDAEEPRAVNEEMDEFLTETEEAGRTLKRLREEKGWTVSEFSERLGISSQLLDRMEAGSQPISEKMAKKIGAHLHVDHHVFF